MLASTAIESTDREGLTAWYRDNRTRSAAIFDVITDEAYYSRPIDLRHPPVFYEGHLPAFSFNTLIKRGLGLDGIDAHLETLFARGIDPHESQSEQASVTQGWPTREQVQQFSAEADRRVIDAILHADIEQNGHPLLTRAEATYAILEHEAMHHETLLYMWHQLPYTMKRQPRDYEPVTDGTVPVQRWIDVPAGRATLGVNPGTIPFSWDNERPAHAVDVDAFAIDQHDITNAAFLEFVEAGGYREPKWWREEDWAWISERKMTHPQFWEPVDGAWHWRGMFASLPLPLAWPVYVSFAEAWAFAQWRGVRLPTEAEFQRAAYGTPDGTERFYPWGDEPATVDHGVFDLASWDPHPAGATPKGQSAWGVHDLVGNGWEWTSTPFAPFEGFTPIPSYPEYSADFFDNDHFVIKGASPATPLSLVRPTFRNWFRPRYPYVYATFRCARSAGQ